MTHPKHTKRVADAATVHESGAAALAVDHHRVEGDLKPAGGIVGTGFEEFRWPRPVRPGDELHVECEILNVRPSKSRSGQGLIKLRTATFNQNNEAVQIMVGTILVPRRSKQE
jgi:acyl dehydratase